MWGASNSVWTWDRPRVFYVFPPFIIQNPFISDYVTSIEVLLIASINQEITFRIHNTECYSSVVNMPALCSVFENQVVVFSSETHPTWHLFVSPKLSSSLGYYFMLGYTTLGYGCLLSHLSQFSIHKPVQRNV